MAELGSLKVIEVYRVAPKPPQATLHSTTPAFLHHLTFFDLFWLRFPPFERVFFYETSTSFSESVLPKLKNSLSIALHHFLPLAGHFTWPENSHKPVLNYVQGDTIGLTVCECIRADDFHLLSSNHMLKAKDYHPLVPQLEISHEKSALLAVQVTVFPNIGFSIGTTTHHSIADGRASTLFLKSWAYLCKHGRSESAVNVLPDELKPFYGKVDDSAGLESIYSNQFLNMDQPNNRSLMPTLFQSPPPPDAIRGTFQFAQKKIESLRQFVMRKQQNQLVQLSTFSVTCAYTWVCLVKAVEMKGDKIPLNFSVDCRSRLDPPLPENYFGNCIVGRQAVAQRKCLIGEDGLAVAAIAISDAVKALEKGVLKGAENGVSILYNNVQSSSEYRAIPVASSHRFMIYEAADFGWGRPVRTEVVTIDRTGAISISESKNGSGGVEVGLVLDKHCMDAFASLFAEGLEEL